MIHAFALEPRLVATWGRREEFRFVVDKFGLGTPRVLLELPAFRKWMEEVSVAGSAIDLSETEWKRIEELFKLFGQHRCRREDSQYDDVVTWLENAEREHGRQEFRAIVAMENPRRHPAVVLGDDIGLAKAQRWTCSTGTTPSRRPQDIAAALSGLLSTCRSLHLIDPHFRPDSRRHREMLVELVGMVAARGSLPVVVVRLLCGKKSELQHFDEEAARLASRLPVGVSVEFLRVEEKLGGERLHNRYVLTDLGGVSLGVGLDAGGQGETDDLNLMTREQYVLRWSQYADGPTGAAAFTTVDVPRTVVGSMASRVNSRGGRQA